MSSAGGSRSWTRRRRRPRCGASGREGALLPSRLPRAGPAPAGAAGARGAGRLHGRRKEERRGPHPAPGGAETRSPGPGRVSPGLAGRGSGEEAAGVCTAAEPSPERPLMKARRPSSARPLAPPPPAPGIPLAVGRGPWGPPGP